MSIPGHSEASVGPLPDPPLHLWCTSDLLWPLTIRQAWGSGWTWAAGEGGMGRPCPPAAPYAHALAYSSHVPGLPSCHCHNQRSHGWGKCGHRDPLVSLELYYRCYSLSGHSLPSVGFLKTALIPIHHGGKPAAAGAAVVEGALRAPWHAGPGLGEVAAPSQVPFLGQHLGHVFFFYQGAALHLCCGLNLPAYCLVLPGSQVMGHWTGQGNRLVKALFRF